MGQKIYERIHRLEHGDYEIRVWAACEPQCADLEATQQGNEIRAALYSRPSHGPKEIAEAVAALDFCNAVEVTRVNAPNDGMRSGVLIYPDWP